MALLLTVNVHLQLITSVTIFFGMGVSNGNLRRSIGYSRGSGKVDDK